MTEKKIHSAKCTLFITEGKSAKNFAVSGISILGSDYYGAYALKREPLNVRKEKKSATNEEFLNLCSLLGLDLSKKI